MIGRILSVTVFLLVLITMPVLSGSSEEVSVKYAEVTTPRVIIRKEVEPKSDLVLAAKEGQTFEISGEGKLWVKVKTENGEGWLPISACRIVDRKTTSLLSNPSHTIAFVAVIFIGLSTSLFFLLRRKEDEDTF